MKEVKSPKKPLYYYYGIVLLVIVLVNLFLTPMLSRAQVTDVDYGTFMDMIEEQNIGSVEVDDTQILFTDKDNTQIYRTGVMEDPTLTQRLYDAGAVFDRNMDDGSPSLLTSLLTFLLPLIIFIALGQYMNKKLMEQMGGKNSMAFGMGKSSAKFMCSLPRASGLMMWQARRRPRKVWLRLWIICITRRNIQRWEHPCPRAFFLWALPEQERPCWPRQ